MVIALLSAAIIASGSQALAQDLQIGIIDFYGLNHVSSGKVREVLTFKEGDSISLAGDTPPSMLVDVGIEERGAPTMRLRAPQRGQARLAADIVGDTPFLPMPRRVPFRNASSSSRSATLPQLRLVLRSSSDAAQRALAAQVLGYAADKQAVVNDLVYGMTDASGRGSQQRDACAARICRDGAKRRPSGAAHPARTLHRISEFACVVGPQQSIRRADDAFCEAGCVAPRQAAPGSAYALGGNGALEERWSRAGGVRHSRATGRLHS